MLYTVLNPYDVLCDRKMQDISFEYQSFEGRIIEYVSVNGQKKLNRLYSTDPYDFLNLENSFKNR